MKHIILVLLIGSMLAIPGVRADGIDFNDPTIVGSPEALTQYAQDSFKYLFGDDCVMGTGSLNAAFRDPQGNTLLHLALMRGGDSIDLNNGDDALNVASFLIQQVGIDPFVKNKRGKNALDLMLAKLEFGLYLDSELCPICILTDTLCAIQSHWYEQAKRTEGQKSFFPLLYYIKEARKHAREQELVDKHNRASYETLTTLQTDVENELALRKQIDKKPSSADVEFIFEGDRQ